MLQCVDLLLSLFIIPNIYVPKFFQPFPKFVEIKIYVMFPENFPSILKL